ncbi:MAG: UDP-N-acetyl-alpha-D-glucosamine C6 dehydratase [Phycisphaerae bacterium]|nr:UDP-N-acetyl-alpha-D-glucosamine C6 dehydratase [Phycisphaerae bacterium]
MANLPITSAGRTIPQTLIWVVSHATLFSLSLLAGFVLAYNFAGISVWFFPQYMMLLPLFLLLKYLAFSLFHQLDISWRYFGQRDFFASVIACVLATLVAAGCVAIFHTVWGFTRWGAITHFPNSVYLIDLLLSIVLFTGIRFASRYFYEQGRSSAHGPRTLIVGAGDAGETLLREIQRQPDEKHLVVGFLDDDPGKLGRRIHGVPVLGPIAQVKSHCGRLAIEQVLIAIPSASPRRIREIIHTCEGAQVIFRIVPGLSELIEGTLTIESQLRRVKVEDLLQRRPVQLDHHQVAAYLQNKVVMVTGAGGSIGSEMCRQIARFQPQRLVLVELCENNLFELERELRRSHPDLPLAPYLADICDRSRMSRIFELEQPVIIAHAAAHKHVPMLEAHPGEGIKNNIIGTMTLADLAVLYNVRKFVYISTDKAVNPTSIMGCTKRIAEIYIQGLTERSRTQFITTRFGNVLGSRGSAIPIFQEQIAAGGPVTVTHPDMTRYFMTIPEAAQLVLQAGAIGRGGEIFLLEMGEPIRIVDLVKNLITLSGLIPEVDIDIVYTGLRPGEKLYEELYIEGEGLSATSHPNIRVWQKRGEDWNALVHRLPELLAQADTATTSEIKTSLSELIPEYQLHYKPLPETSTLTAEPQPAAAT